MIVQTPPMGWNTWNTFGPDIHEQLVRECADALVERGFRDAGYQYCIVDDCWSEKSRDPVTDRIVTDRQKFPSGMKALGDYIHQKGLRFGMYSCAGVRTCEDYPGSFGHEFLDAQMFAEYGCDYLKYDFCKRPSVSDGPQLYRIMGQALRSTGRDILFAACNWGSDDVWNWIRTTGASTYRSTADIIDTFESFRSIAESQLDKQAFNANNCFNDLDMLTVGMNGKGLVALENGGCTAEEYQMQFLLWCILGSPLILGCDVRTVDDATVALLTNRELIRINQDLQCCQTYCLNSTYHKDRYILVRLLSDGDMAIGYFNFSDESRILPLYFSDLGFPVYCGKKFCFTNLMTGEEQWITGDYFNTVMQPKQSILYRVRVAQR